MAILAKKPVEFTKFSGLRNNTAPERFGLDDLRAAINADVDDSGRIATRAGFTSRLAGDSHSLWCDNQEPCLVVQGTTLKRVRQTGAGSYQLDTLRTGLTNGARLSYWRVNDRVFYVNSHETGVIQGFASRSFGLVNPIGQPVAAAIGGLLPIGRYQYALTYLRSDGQESGTGTAGTIDLMGRGGIRFSSIPVSSDPSVVSKAIYITATNGEMMYRALVIANSVTSANYMNAGLDLRLKLTTQLGEPAPAGHIVSWFRGRTLVAEGPALWYSAPYRYELFMLGKAHKTMPADITMVAPVEDGVFISADMTYFASGVSPEDWVLRAVASYPAIPGTLSYVPVEGGYVGDGLPGRVAVWASTRGHCVGTNGGSFKNMTEGRFSYPTAQRGAGILRQVNGFNQYLAVLEGTGTSNNAQS